MTAGRINQVSISTLSATRRRRMLLSFYPLIQSLSSNTHDLSVSTDSQTSACPTTVALRMHQFCLKGSTARAFHSGKRGRPPRFSRHFSARHLVRQRRTAPHRAARRRRQATDDVPTLIGSQWKKSFYFFLVIGETYASTRYIRQSLTTRTNRRVR